MRSYKILEEKVKRFNQDTRIQNLLKQVSRGGTSEKLLRRYSSRSARTLLDMDFDRAALAQRPLPYEELDQRLFDLLMGV